MAWQAFFLDEELFAGLAAEQDHDWSKAYPVIRIGFSSEEKNITEIKKQDILCIH